jgi:hypothetical protein
MHSLVTVAAFAMMVLTPCIVAMRAQPAEGEDQ